MASNKEYLDFILEQLSELSDITYRQMMGEYIVYYRGKIVGGIYDDRFLVKPVKSAISLMPDAAYELPYEGAKQMLVVDNVDSKRFLKKLFEGRFGSEAVCLSLYNGQFSLKTWQPFQKFLLFLIAPLSD